MQNKISMETVIRQAENRFSLDELVKKVADSYEKKAFADILEDEFATYPTVQIKLKFLKTQLRTHLKNLFHKCYWNKKSPQTGAES